jgi:hypothetical protein
MESGTISGRGVCRFEIYRAKLEYVVLVEKLPAFACICLALTQFLSEKYQQSQLESALQLHHWSGSDGISCYLVQLGCRNKVPTIVLFDQLADAKQPLTHVM